MRSLRTVMTVAIVAMALLSGGALAAAADTTVTSTDDPWGCDHDDFRDAPFCSGPSDEVDRDHFCASGPDTGTREYYASAGSVWWLRCVSEDPYVKLCAASETPVWDEQDRFVGCEGFVLADSPAEVSETPTLLNAPPQPTAAAATLPETGAGLWLLTLLGVASVTSGAVALRTSRS